MDNDKIIIADSLKLLKELLKNNIYDNETLNCSLSYYVYHDNQRYVEILLNNGADINNIDYRNSPLMLASQYGLIGMMNYLIYRKADVNIKNLSGETALMYACMGNNIDAVKTLLSNRDCDINATDVEGKNALFYPWDPNIFYYLILYGINIHQENIHGNNVLYHYCWLYIVFREEAYIVVKILLDAGVSPNNLGVLFMAIHTGGFKLAKLLLDYGADPNIHNGEKIPIFNAISDNKIDVLKLLLENNADPNVYDINYGITPLIFAVIEENYTMVKLLLEFGADPNLNDKNRGYTALMRAVTNGNSAIAKLLLENNADPNIDTTGYDKYPKTAYIMALDRMNNEIQDILLKYGADPNLFRS